MTQQVRCLHEENENARKALSWSVFFFCAFLPLTSALTLNIGFPLKLYELILVVWMFGFFMAVLLNGWIIKYKLNISKYYFIILLCFLLIETLSILMGYYPLVINIPFTSWANGKDAYLISSLLKITYYISNIYIFFFIALNFQKFEKRILYGWMVGALFASLYSGYILVSGLLFGASPVLLPGMTESAQHGYISGVEVIRGGTFREGNYFSLYLFCTIALAVYRYKKGGEKIYFFTATAASLAMVATLSTLGILVLLTFYSWILITKKYIRGYFSFFVKLILLVITATFLFLFIISEYAQTHLWSKLLLSEDLWVQGSSLYDRLQTSSFGFDLFLNNPILGVGLSNFPYYFDAEYHLGGKVIVNNIYIELLAEGGLLLFLSFSCFILLIVKDLLSAIRVDAEKKVLLFSIFAILFQFMAYPSLTLTYLWVYFGIVVSYARVVKST